MLERADELAAEFRREGVLVLPGILARDPLFLDYVAELRALLLALYAQAGRQPDEQASLATLTTELARTVRWSVASTTSAPDRPSSSVLCV